MLEIKEVVEELTDGTQQKFIVNDGGLYIHIDKRTKKTADMILKLQPLYALIFHKVFSLTAPQNVFEAEFGKVAQSVYSRCIGSGSDGNTIGSIIEHIKAYPYIQEHIST